MMKQIAYKTERTGVYLALRARYTPVLSVFTAYSLYRLEELR